MTSIYAKVNGESCHRGPVRDTRVGGLNRQSYVENLSAALTSNCQFYLIFNTLFFMSEWYKPDCFSVRRDDYAVLFPITENSKTLKGRFVTIGNTVAWDSIMLCSKEKEIVPEVDLVADDRQYFTTCSQPMISNGYCVLVRAGVFER